MPAEDWDRVVGVNLSGVFHCIQAFLGIMRRSGGAVVVNIVSTAARLVSPGAGTHYCAAKRGLVSLTESVNIEEGRNGIRACAICPGEVATALVSQRPEPPGPARLAQMLQPEDVAEAVHYAVTQPTRVTVSELVIFPSAQISGVNVI
ncbi:MAG: SDR family oxidoreductase [Planctomycetota bacterium]|jgi:NAD(P)-dependent dehydrogenase (short-subunit alcohol dehydrogenase family)